MSGGEEGAKTRREVNAERSLLESEETRERVEMVSNTPGNLDCFIVEGNGIVLWSTFEGK